MSTPLLHVTLKCPLLTFNLSCLTMRSCWRTNSTKPSHLKLAALPCKPTSRALPTSTIKNLPTSRRSRFPPRLNPRSQYFAVKNNNGYSPRGNGGYPTSNQPAPFRNFNRGNYNQQSNSNVSTNQTSHPACQICGKSNHNALDCYNKMDYTYQGRHPPPQLAAMVAQVNEDFETQDWLADSGANTHITADPSNINNPQRFGGTETVGVGNGVGLVPHLFIANHQTLLTLLNFYSKIYYIVLMPLLIFSPLTNFP